METNGRHYFSLWKGLVVGSFLGSAAALLLAPKSGRELRSEIKGKTYRALDETKRLYSHGETKFRDTLAWFCGKREKASLSHMESPEEIVADA